MQQPHQTVPAVPVDGFDQAQDRAGAFYFEEHSGRDYITWCCPCGCGDMRQIAVQPGAAPGNRVWGWNGDQVRPTLQPSIRYMTGCRWHGFLTSGMWTPCGDSGQ